MLEVYLDPIASQILSQRQNNEAHQSVTETLQKLIQEHKKSLSLLTILSEGSHPESFKPELLKQFNQVNWCGLSENMIKIGQQNTPECLTFNLFTHNSDQTNFLESLPDSSQDVICMKFTLAHTKDIDSLFQTVHKKLTPEGIFIANFSDRSHLPSKSRNAIFTVNNSTIPDEGIDLQAGDSYTVHFLQEFNNPEAGVIPNGSVTFIYRSLSDIQQAITNSSLQTISFNQIPESGSKDYFMILSK